MNTTGTVRALVVCLVFYSRPATTGLWLPVESYGQLDDQNDVDAARPYRSQGVDGSYVSRMVDLTTLAPDIVGAILDDTLPEEVTLFDLAAGTPVI